MLRRISKRSHTGSDPREEWKGPISKHSKKNGQLENDVEAPMTPRVRKKRRKITSPIISQDDDELPTRLRELETFQEALSEDDSETSQASCIVQYFHLNGTAKCPLTEKELENCGILLQLMPNGRLHYFDFEGWRPLPSAVDVTPNLDQSMQIISLELSPMLWIDSTLNKKKKSRAHVLKPGALTLIPYGMDERVTWTRRIFHFMGKMRKVLGDRSLGSPWGGSIIDSMIGVLLTQNVSDTYSSKAFMNIAAKFPAPPSENLFGNIVDWKKVLTSPTSELSDCIQCRGMQHMNASRIKSHSFSPFCYSSHLFPEHSSLSLRMALSTNGGKNKSSTKLPQLLTLKKQSTTSVLNLQSLPHCAVNGRSEPTNSALPEIKIPQESPAELSLEWMRELDYDSVAELLTSRLEGFGEKSAACVTLLAFHWKCFPVDVNVARICARLGWVPLKTTEKIEDLDLYAPDLEVHKYLKKRLLHLDFDVLYELHYQMITMGKVFCTKRSPRCDACPLRGKCEYALNGGKKFQDASPLSGKKSRVKSEELSPKTPVKKEGVVVDMEDIIPWNKEENEESPNTRSSKKVKAKGEEEVLRIIQFAETKEVGGIQDVNSGSALDKKIALKIMSLEYQHQVAEIRRNYKFYSKLIHPDKCQHPHADLAFSLLNLAYHQLMNNEKDGNGMSSEADEEEDEDFVDSRLPLAVRTPMTSTKSRNIFTGIMIRNNHQLSSYIPYLHNKDMILMPDPRVLRFSDLPQSPSEMKRDGTWDAFVLVPARQAMNNRFPLNGTFFQINEVFLMDGDPFTLPFSILFQDGRQHCRIYFGTSISHITLGMATEEVQHLFNGSFVCIRSFDFETRISSNLHSFLTP